VERDSSTIAGFPSISLPSTHSNLSKFRGPHDPDYKCVVSTLKQYIWFAPTKKLWDAIKDGNEDEVGKLLQEQASPTVQDLQGRSALHYAAEKCNKAIMKTILQATSRIDSRDNKGRTALQIAVEKECTDIIDLLFERGAYLEEEFNDIPEKMRRYLGGKPRKLKGPSRHGVQKQDVKLDDSLAGACKAFSLTYTKFYWNRQEELNEDKEKRLISEKSIYEMLYERQVENSSSHPEQPETPSWRWYHIPTNNVCTFLSGNRLN
jgi:ankyrin repeat protein